MHNNYYTNYYFPFRYCFWLKAMRGEDKYVCADTEEDMLKIIAWIIKAKVMHLLNTYTHTQPAKAPANIYQYI